VQAILVVGEGECAQQVARELGAHGYRVEAATQVHDAEAFAAIVICLSAADEAGTLLSDAQQSPVLAVLPEQYLDGRTLDLPVDDLVLYPLRPRELDLRLRRLIGQPAAPPESEDVLRQGALAIDMAGYRVYVDGTLVELTFKEYELLRFLATHPDRVYSREALLDKVWGYDYFGGARTVDVHIRRIRSKIEVGGLTFIETVRSVGYRFHASS
jgi:DNA-binding response OmpR family regulator